MTAHILLIEPDALAAHHSLMARLQAQGYAVDTINTPGAAVAKLETVWPDVIVLNGDNASGDDATHLPDIVEQTTLGIPWLVVGSQHRVYNNRIIVLADKTHLIPNVEQVITRDKDRFIRLPALTLDCYKYQVLRGGKSYSLTPKEFKLLSLLLSYANEIIPRKVIMQEVWETDYMGDTRTLDVHIRWLREKIEVSPSKPRLLRTVRGVGYRFVTHPDETD